MQNLKLLMVDDSPVQREYMLLCHDIRFAQVSSAENGEIALPMLQQQVDALICNLKMPSLDGIELLHKVALLNCHAAVIIVSGRE
jgi:CheY-like chemotaxis protein